MGSQVIPNDPDPLVEDFATSADRVMIIHTISILIRYFAAADCLVVDGRMQLLADTVLPPCRNGL